MEKKEHGARKNHWINKRFAWIADLSLKTKLLISFLVIGIVSLLLSGYYFYVRSYDVILQNSRQYTMEMLFQVDKHIQSIDNISLSIVVNRSLGSLLNETDEVKKGRNKRQVDQYIRSILIGSKEISSLVIIDRNGTAYGLDDCRISNGFNLESSMYYIEAVKHKGNNVWFGRKESIMIFSGTEAPLMVFPTSAIIKSFYPYGDYLGFLLINLKQSAFMDILSGIYADKSGNILMLGRDKKVMLSTKPLDDSIPDNCFENIRGEKGSYNFKIEGVDNLVTYLRDERTGWYTVSIMPVEFLIKDTDQIKKAILNISLLIIFLCISLSLLVTLGITKGFKRLKSVMVKVRSGEFDIRVNSRRRDEIGQLSNTFDTMLGQINDLIQKNYEQKIREKNAQLKALQAQITPHFLYNALDSINWMLIEKEEQEISSIVIALGDLLRYSINNKKDMMPVKDEVRQIENYLKIQKVRFEERFTYDIHVQDGLNEKLIPKLFIQPIVENALIHGIEKRSSDGKIEVKGYKTEQNVIFEVKDNGMGISEEMIAAIFDDSEEKIWTKCIWALPTSTKG